jgi:hypothetical protein
MLVFERLLFFTTSLNAGNLVKLIPSTFDSARCSLNKKVKKKS